MLIKIKFDTYPPLNTTVQFKLSPETVSSYTQLGYTNIGNANLELPLLSRRIR